MMAFGAKVMAVPAVSATVVAALKVSWYPFVTPLRVEMPVIVVPAASPLIAVATAMFITSRPEVQTTLSVELVDPCVLCTVTPETVWNRLLSLVIALLPLPELVALTRFTEVATFVCELFQMPTRTSTMSLGSLVEYANRTCCTLIVAGT
jgi:hypothetical protein